jgi:peptide/nickel transport system permease protein
MTARWLLTTLLAVCLLGPYLAPARPEAQFRDFPSAPPCRAFWLGTDELGRDVFSRLLYALRSSVLTAAPAAAAATLLGCTLGAAAGWWGGCWRLLVSRSADLLVSLPWILLLLAARAAFPLDLPPQAGLALVFFLLALLGWGPAARLGQMVAAQIRQAPFVLQAHAAGLSEHRILLRHVASQLRHTAVAQFWATAPAFVAAEMNLSLLGLGAPEPTPSLGVLLRPLSDPSTWAQRPWLLAPVATAVTLLVLLQQAAGKDPA